MPVHGKDHLRCVNTKLPCRGFEDAHIGLMRHQPVDLGRSDTAGGTDFASHFIQHPHRKLENRLTVHAEEGAAGNGTARDIARHREDAGV